MIYRFKGFQFDAVRESLIGPDGPIALRDQALRVLKVLIERAPGLVSKDEILDSVWGHEALSESSIPQAIKDIRLALGDSAKNPDIIITRYGRGYQFVAELEDDAVADSVTKLPTHAAQQSQIGQLLRFWPLMLAVLVLSALLAPWPFSSEPEVAQIDIGQDQPLLLRPVTGGAADSLSEPFARYLAFVVGRAIGSENVSVLDPDEDVGQQPVIDLQLDVSERDDADNRFALALIPGNEMMPLRREDRVFRYRTDQAAELLQSSLDAIYARFEVDTINPEVGLTSTSNFAVETLLRGMTALFAGELDRAREMFEAALAEDPSFDFARYELAITLRRQGEYQRSLAMILALEQRVSGAFWQQKMDNAAGIALWRLGRLDEAAARLNNAMALAESPVGKSIYGNNIGLILRDQRRFDEARMVLAQSVEFAVEAEHPRSEASARNTLASVLMRLGELDLALDELGQAEQLFVEVGDRAAYASVMSRSARVLRIQGDLATASQKALLSAEVRRQLGDELGVASSLLLLASLEHVRGQFQAARGHIIEAQSFAEPFNELNLLHNVQLQLAKVSLAEGQFADASLHMAESLRLAELRNDVNDTIQSRMLELLIKIEQAESGALQSEVARQAIASFQQQFSLEQGTQEWSQLRLLQARLARLDQDLSAAQALFQSALDAAEPLNQRDVQLMALHGLARLMLIMPGAENEARAYELLDKAEEINPAPYPHLLIQSEVAEALGNSQDALALAIEAREKSGDWWQPEDENWLQQLMANQ